MKNTMDEAYEMACKYVDVSKEQFNELYTLAQAKINEWKSQNGELNEDDLDMIVGGSSVGDFFSSLGNALLSAGKYAIEHPDVVVVVAGLALVCGGLGVAAGVGIAAHLGASAVAGGIVGGITGTGLGIGCLFLPE